MLLSAGLLACVMTSFLPAALGEDPTGVPNQNAGAPSLSGDAAPGAPPGGTQAPDTPTPKKKHRKGRRKKKAPPADGAQGTDAGSAAGPQGTPNSLLGGPAHQSLRPPLH